MLKVEYFENFVDQILSGMIFCLKIKILAVAASNTY